MIDGLASIGAPHGERMPNKITVVIIVLAARTLYAEPNPEVIQLTESARSVARAGRCHSVDVIRDRVRELDPVYFNDVFLRDPVIARCVNLPPSLAPQGALAPLPDADGAKSGPVAFWASVLTTVAGYGLAAFGVAENSPGLYAAGGITAVVGPTVGHIYAGHTWNSGLTMRLVSLAATAVGIGLAFDNDAAAAATLLVLGGLGYTTGAIYEIVTAPEAVHEYNRAHGFEASFTFAPVKARDGAAPGLALVGRF